MVKVELTGLLPGVSEFGRNEQLIPEGKSAQESETVCAAGPETGATVIWELAELPGVRLTSDGDATSDNEEDAAEHPPEYVTGWDIWLRSIGLPTACTKNT